MIHLSCFQVEDIQSRDKRTIRASEVLFLAEDWWAFHAVVSQLQKERNALVSLLSREFHEKNPGVPEPDWVTMALAAEAAGEKA